MRTITNDELPQITHHQVVIRISERTRHQKMASALERTLSRCSEIHADYEKQTARLRENCEKQGFEAGFELFFSQLIALLDEYASRQQQRQQLFRQHIFDALCHSLHDPTIVERIIHHLQEHCGHQKPVRIIIPAAVKLPGSAEASNYQYTDDNHITVQNDMDSIRFPSDALCRQWLASADDIISSHDAITNQLIPNFYHNIASILLGLAIL